MLDTFNKDTFAGRIGQNFRILLDKSEPLELRLVQLRDLGSRTSPLATGKPARTPFSLIFQGPPTPALLQQTYHFQHAELGAFDLFIVPVARIQAGFQYEAVFT